MALVAPAMVAAQLKRKPVRPTPMLRLEIPATMLVFVGVGVLAMPHPAVSQIPRPQVGDRVRVQSDAPRSDRLTGRLVALNADSLSMEVSGDLHRFALHDLEYLKVSTGEKSHLAGTVVGGLLGAVIGAVAGAALERTTSNQCFDYCGLEGGLIGLVVGGIGGAIGGYHILAHEHFADLPVSALGFRVEHGGLSVALSF